MAGCTGCISLVILLQVAAAVAIIVIIPLHLQQIQWDASKVQGVKIWEGFVESNACLLGSGFHNNHLCTYGIAAAAISVATSLMISLLQCISCNLCSFGPFIDVIFQGAGTAWWVVASIIVTRYSRQANTEGLPQENWRNTVTYLSWALAGLFAVGLFVSIGRSLTGPCRRRSKPAPASVQFMTTPAPYAVHNGGPPVVYNGKVPTPAPYVPPGYVVRPAV